jgi:hypothetical protein
MGGPVQEPIMDRLFPTLGVGNCAVLVVGVPGFATQYHVLSWIFSQLSRTEGFIETNSSKLNIPNILTIRSHVSPPIVEYQDLQSRGLPLVHSRDQRGFCDILLHELMIEKLHLVY